jgi:hypothetical protein
MTQCAQPITALICAGLMLAAPAVRAAPPADDAASMADFFKGTLAVDNPVGEWSGKYFFEPNHTYKETGSDGPVTGTWSIEGDRFCTVPDKGPAAPDRAARYCNLGVGRHTGEQWKDNDPVTGNMVLFSLKAGRN